MASGRPLDGDFLGPTEVPLVTLYWTPLTTIIGKGTNLVIGTDRSRFDLSDNSAVGGSYDQCSMDATSMVLLVSPFAGQVSQKPHVPHAPDCACGQSGHKNSKPT